MSASIVKNCLVVNIQLGVWLGHKLDRVTTSKVTDDAGAASDAGRFNKHLIPKECLKEIQTTAGATRAHFYQNTLPWKDNGDRLLTRNIATDFIQAHGGHVEKFHAAVQDFLENKYALAMEQAEFRMGELFNAEDYPDPVKLKRKFYINLDIDGVAETKDVRLQDNEEILQARVTKAMAGLWERLANPLKHFQETMSSEDKIFRDATMGNLREIVDLIPALNFTEDPKLEHIRSEIEAELTQYEPEELRKDKMVRKAVAGKAAEIMEEMSGFMAAFASLDDD